MRKRKLYLSELLNRNANKDLNLIIITKTGEHHFDDIKSSLSVLKYHNYLDYQVIEWYITHSTLTQTLIIKI